MKKFLMKIAIVDYYTKMSAVLKILLDLSVLHHSVCIKGKWQSNGEVLWGGKIPVETGIIQSEYKKTNTSEKNGGEQTGYIASLAKYLKTSRNIKFYTTDALMLERLPHPAGKFLGMNDGDVSLFPLDEIIDLNTLENFSFTIPNEEPTKKYREYLDCSQQNPYRKIRDGLEKSGSKKISQDAWHLHCIIKYELDFFLSCDRHLKNSINNQLPKDLKNLLKDKFLQPSDLCQKLGISALNESEIHDFARDIDGYFPNSSYI
jgi:hypothetical protein